MASVRLREIFTPGFWINYVLSLVVTSWIPFAHLKFYLDGKVIRETYEPAYQLYFDVVKNPGATAAYKYIGAHLGIVFLVTVIVWYLVLRRRAAKSASDDA